MRSVRQACTLSPPSAVTMWMGACGVPSRPSFVITPALPRMGDAADAAAAMFRVGSDDIPPADAAAPAHQRSQQYEKQASVKSNEYFQHGK